MPRPPTTPVVLHSKELSSLAVLQYIFPEHYEQDLVSNTSLCMLILQVLFITARVLLSEDETSRNN